MAKRYYWLKLPDGFFRQKAIKKLRKIAGGDTYTIIYLKMLLVAMKQDGRLYFEGVEATFYDELGCNTTLIRKENRHSTLTMDTELPLQPARSASPPHLLDFRGK